MKLGTENRKMVIVASVLGAVAIVTLIWQFGGSSSPSVPASKPMAATAPSAAAPANQQRPNSREHRVGARFTPGLDPRLQLETLRASENLKYEGTGRNIFQENLTEIPKPIGSATLPGPAQKTGATFQPTPPQPPPINLKFYGWASQPGEAKAIFLSQGENIFVAHEGDVIARRYRIGKIGLKDVEIQDVLSNNTQRIPLLCDNPASCSTT